MRPTVPAEILALGRARATARRERDFREADRLRAEIEAAGYRVVDRGADFVLSPAHPDDEVGPDGGVRHGWSGAVPSCLEDRPSAAATLVIVADAGPGPLGITLAGLRHHAPAGTHVVIVAGPDAALDAALTPETLLAPIAGVPPEVVRTAVPLRPAAARNAGARRARGSVVAWLAQGAVVEGDVVSPLVDALAGPHVAVTGAVGLAGTDVRALAPVTQEVEAPSAVAIDRGLLAFRREDLRSLGPLDERFFGDEQLDRWWSLVLRDGPDGSTPDSPEAVPADPRQALAVPSAIDLSAAVPLRAEAAEPAEAARRRKRDLYRLIDRFGGRMDLLRPRSPAA